MSYINQKLRAGLQTVLNLCPTLQFARIHTSSLIKIEKILNRPITKFYNSDDVNVIAGELRLAKTRSTSFYKKQSFIRDNANRCKSRFEN